jgi:hypothetical protein
MTLIAPTSTCASLGQAAVCRAVTGAAWGWMRALAFGAGGGSLWMADKKCGVDRMAQAVVKIFFIFRLDLFYCLIKGITFIFITKII